MHENKVIHRDLKLGNLFLGQNLAIKIGDFGLATRIEHDGERKHTVCGTPNYIAPEILENKHSGHSYEVDYWAIGVIVYTLLIGKPPFETEDVKETYKKITADKYEFPSNVFISEEAKDFIKEILVINPNDRLTPDQMLKHSFMTITPLPKEMPTYTLSNPPKISFFRTYDINEEGKGGRNTQPITKATQLSFINEKENLEIMRDFALHTLKKCDMNIGYFDFYLISFLVANFL
jgi:polo-like kinase 1